MTRRLVTTLIQTNVVTPTPLLQLNQIILGRTLAQHLTVTHILSNQETYQIQFITSRSRILDLEMCAKVNGGKYKQCCKENKQHMSKSRQTHVNI